MFVHFGPNQGHPDVTGTMYLDNVSVKAAVVPAPATLSLVALGGLGLLLLKRRKAV